MRDEKSAKYCILWTNATGTSRREELASKHVQDAVDSVNSTCAFHKRTGMIRDTFQVVDQPAMVEPCQVRYDSETGGNPETGNQEN